jgi:hypothetical protein
VVGGFVKSGEDAENMLKDSIAWAESCADPLLQKVAGIANMANRKIVICSGDPNPQEIIKNA